MRRHLVLLVILLLTPSLACAGGLSVVGSGSGGSGTINPGVTNCIPKYIAPTTLDDSLVCDDGTTLIYSGTGGIAAGATGGGGKLILPGATSGTLQLWGAAVSGTSVVRFPAGSTDFSATGGTGQYLKQASAGAALTVGTIPLADLPATAKARGIVFEIGDPGGSALSAATTTTAYVTVPFACTLSAYNLLIDAGTITVKFWKVATGTAIPTSGDSISTSGVGIASGTAIHSATMSDFTTTTVTKDDILAMNVVTTATTKYVSGTLQCDL